MVPVTRFQTSVSRIHGVSPPTPLLRGATVRAVTCLFARLTGFEGRRICLASSCLSNSTSEVSAFFLPVWYFPDGPDYPELRCFSSAFFSFFQDRTAQPPRSPVVLCFFMLRAYTCLHLEERAASPVVGPDGYRVCSLFSDLPPFLFASFPWSPD